VIEAPIVLGVDTRLRMAGSCPSWSCCFGILYVSITQNGGDDERPLYEARVGNKTVALNSQLTDAVSVIESELMTIANAVSAAEKARK
jgi:hypothetical protein